MKDFVRLKGSKAIWKVTGTRPGYVEAKTISEPYFDNVFRNDEIEEVDFL